jgi:twitching motility protein PilT
MEVYSILFNRLLSETAKRQASDLHLSAGSIPVIRKDGHLITLEEEKIIEETVLEQIVTSFLTEAEQKTLAKKREITVVKVLGGHFRFKINIYFQKGLLAVSLRLVTPAVRDFNSLGLPPAVANFSRLSDGLVVIGGIYGSGKTTTIGALLELINQQQKKRMLTLENPIETIFANQQSIIEQREVGKDVPTLVSGLQYCRHEDIDIIAIADIRDELSEVLPLILKLAASGSLVFLEMHADSAARVIENIMDAFLPHKAAAARALLADVLRGIAVQRLVPKNGGGQALALEVLLGSPAVTSVIREGKFSQLETIIQTSGGEGMVSMTTSLSRLVASGQVSREDALAAAPNKEDFEIMSS